jgi:ABC-type multidrug transport system permease subunit
VKSYLTLIRMEARLAFRQRVVIFFNYLMPLTFFFVFGQISHAERGGAITQIVVMVLVIGILGNGLFGAGMRAVQDRENNILRRFKVAPISALPLLIASIATGLIVYLPCVVLVLAIAVMRYGMAVPGNPVSVLLFVALGVAAIRSLGLIVASVVNSVQESGIIVQILYMAMLFLSGSTIPISVFPDWLLTANQFLPATWLVTGLQGIFVRHESLLENIQAAGALALTTVVGLTVCVRLFRWEKEEKVRASAKLWVLAVLAPFLLLGSWQVYSRDNVRKAKMLEREMARNQTSLIRNARIFTGTGKVIENGAVLIKGGKIAAVYEGRIPDPQELRAAPVEAAGKTLLPGLVELDAHVGGPSAKALRRVLAAYLYCGVTAVRSLDASDAPGGEALGADVFPASVARGIAPASVQRFPAEALGSMAMAGTLYEPRLSAAEVATGTSRLLERSLVQQVATPESLAAAKRALDSRPPAPDAAARFEIARDNLLGAWKNGVRLVAGSGLDGPILIPGPTVQHEIALWVAAGIPAAVALKAATLDGATALGAGARFGSIEAGKDATLLAVDGNPLEDIRALEAVSFVVFHGERVNRGQLLIPGDAN